MIPWVWKQCPSKSCSNLIADLKGICAKTGAFTTSSPKHFLKAHILSIMKQKENPNELLVFAQWLVKDNMVKISSLHFHAFFLKSEWTWQIDALGSYSFGIWALIALTYDFFFFVKILILTTFILLGKTALHGYPWHFFSYKGGNVIILKKEYICKAKNSFLRIKQQMRVKYFLI